MGDLFTMGKYFYNKSEWRSARDWFSETLFNFNEDFKQRSYSTEESRINTDTFDENGLLVEKISPVDILDYLAFSSFKVLK